MVLITVLVSGCYAEGRSFWVGVGEPEYFLTMDACLEEARSTFPSGGRRYSGYECRYKLLVFTLEKVRVTDPDVH